MKNLKNLGQALTKAEQKTIDGGKIQLLPNEILVYRCYYSNGVYRGCTLNAQGCLFWPGTHAVAATTCL